jgi:hypothetical protein
MLSILITDGYDWLASSPGCFITGETNLGNILGPRDGQDDKNGRQIFVRKI